jgi:hypothetical protein
MAGEIPREAQDFVSGVSLLGWSGNGGPTEQAYRFWRLNAVVRRSTFIAPPATWVGLMLAPQTRYIDTRQEAP